MRIAFTHNTQIDHDDESQAEFDRPETIAEICEAIAHAGHDVTSVDVSGPPSRVLARIERLKPDLVFNTAEGFHGRYREAFYPGLFEQLGVPYTGSDAYVCALTLDKQLTKLLVQAHGIPTPRWVFVDDMSTFVLPELTYPVIVKPNFEGSSKGITVDSIVEHESDLRERVASILAKYPTGLLIEEFIVGRDVVVPYLEAASPSTGGVLTAAAYRFDEAIIGKRKYTLYDYELKCVSSHAVEVEVPAQIPDDVARRVQELSRKVFKVLGVRDLGRIDYRVTEDGRVTFLEVNALPSLEPGAGIYLCAALAGLREPSDVLDAVIESACRRYGIANSKSTSSQHGKPTSGLRVGLTFNLKRKSAKKDGDDDSEAEYDSRATIDALHAAIASAGHDVVELEATADIVRALPDAGVDVVFNLAEGVRGRSREAQVPALLEMLDIPFSGSDATSMAICLDKALAKSVVRDAGVPTPRAFTMITGEEPLPSSLRFPVIVKPNTEGSSKGVLPRSVVESEDALRTLVREMFARYRQELLVEEFLVGREFTVALLGEHGERVLPPMEIVYVKPDTAFPIYAFEDKLDWTEKIRYDTPAVVDDALRAELTRVAQGAFRALGCRDIARLDLRLDGEGRVNFIEANTLPGITPDWSDLCLIAKSIGLSYNDLVNAILAPAIARHARARAATGGEA